MSERQIALALTGGGARAAYQVGWLRHLAHAFPELRPTILTGVSAGAINAAFLASSRRPFRETVERLAQLWLSIDTDRVYRVDARSVLGHVGGWGARLLFGGSDDSPRLRGMVDTVPLRGFLAEHLPLEADGVLANVERNLNEGRIDALAISTTSYATGESVTFAAGRPLTGWARPRRRVVHERLTIEHVMASAALPLFFPAIRLGDGWHGDGGIRLTAPLAPALHLGATHILAVSPRYLRAAEGGDHAPPLDYPTPARIGGVLMNALFLDMLDHDVQQMQRINGLLARLPKPARGGLRRVNVLVSRPSRDLGVLASDYEARLPRLFRFFERGIASTEGRSSDFLALVLFERDYLARLIELGEHDAAQRHDELAAFLAEPA